MAQYKLAVVIPSWNCSTDIRVMLDSILANSFSDFRVFVVDDHSTDNSVAVINEYASIDHRIKLIVRDRLPKGAQTCRNIGFEQTKDAEYVVWFDSDDVVAPYCFEQRVNYMDCHPELDFGIFPAKSFVKDIWDEELSNYSYGVRYMNDSLQAMLNLTLPMVGWTNIYRRCSIVEKALTWDERILSMQDSDFNIACLISGLKHNYAIEEGAKVDYFYRIIMNRNNIASKISTTPHFKSHLILLNKILCSLSKEQLNNYETDLKCYLYLFGCMFINDDKTYDEFLRLSFFDHYPLFKFSMKVFRAVNGNYRLARLFMLSPIPKIVSERQKSWISFMKTNKKNMIRMHETI